MFFLDYSRFTDEQGSQGMILIIAEITLLRSSQLLALMYFHDVQKVILFPISRIATPCRPSCMACARAQNTIFQEVLPRLHRIPGQM